MPRTPEELKKAVSEQRSAIRASCKAFDGGDRWEARRIATAIINLVFDKARTQSLLTQLGVKATTSFLSTSEPSMPGNLLTWHPLIMFVIGSGARYEPQLETHSYSNFMPFDDWWNESVYEDGNLTLTRSVLLRTLRDQDGGSHYDPEISDKAYKLMKSGAGWGFMTPDGSEHPMEDAELATVRQIAYEVEITLDKVGLR